MHCFSSDAACDVAEGKVQYLPVICSGVEVYGVAENGNAELKNKYTKIK